MSEIIDRDKMEELLYAIQNAAHTEYHLLEVQEKNNDKGDLSWAIMSARDTRRVLMEQLVEMFEENEIGAVWCVIKHALLLHFHLLELYEKDYEEVYINEAKKVYLMVNDLIKTKYNGYSNCARCDGDRDVEQTDLFDSPITDPLGEPMHLPKEYPTLNGGKAYLVEHTTTFDDNTQYIDATYVVNKGIQSIDIDVIVTPPKTEKIVTATINGKPSSFVEFDEKEV